MSFIRRKQSSVQTKASLLTSIDISTTAATVDHIMHSTHNLDQHTLQQLLHIADAAVANAGAAKPQDNGWLQPLVGALETTLKYIQVCSGGLFLLAMSTCQTQHYMQ